MVSEDDAYRTSTQYRLWSFTPGGLGVIRSSTNAQAAERVRLRHNEFTPQIEASNGDKEVKQQDGAINNANGSNGDTAAASTDAVDCLTAEEELKLVNFYCVKAMELADFCNFPTNVKATAVQFLKRFYLTSSVMSTHHPKEAMPTALFLATKTENHYTSLRSYTSKLGNKTPDDILRLEFNLTQGLRFTFDVRHPHRGLEGGFMELLALANGSDGMILPGSMGGKTPEQVASEIAALSLSEHAEGRVAVQDRIRAAHARAKHVLKGSAILSDAYFLYTPSQIWLAALLLADEPLAMFYLDTKFPSTPNAGSDLKLKVIATLRDCASLMKATPTKPSPEDLKDLKRIDKKLYNLREREGGDTRGIKRESEQPDEKALKKRKQERDTLQKEGDEVFGPALGK